MRRASVALLSLLVLGSGSGCGPDRAAELRKEIKKLEDERTPIDAVQKAKADADAAEAELTVRSHEVEKARSELASLEAEVERTGQAFDREVALNQELRSQIDDATQRMVAAAKRNADLVAQIAEERERAGYLRDRAEPLARELRAGDPAWANARRVQNVSQLLAEAAQTYPDDPVLARLARGAPRPSDPPDAARAAALARSLCDRLRWVYGLDTSSVAAGPPAPSGAAAQPSGEPEPR